MLTKILAFLKTNKLPLLLLSYGIFLIFYKNAGSFMGDEATYSQIAKEMLADKSFFILHWKQQLWFEKPPLVIWLTALSFKLFGVSETSAHLFPGIFSAVSSIVLYKIGKELFKDKLAGFLAGFVFLTTPLILLYTRTVMMDIPVGLFISLCALAVLKLSTKNNTQWWIVFFLSMGLAVMTKSIIGLFPAIFLVFPAVSQGNVCFIKNKFFILGLLLFALITLPWHLHLSLKFGTIFWKDYIGFHVLERLNTQIFAYPWENATNFAYLKLLFVRSGIWVWLFSIFGIFTAINLLPKKFLPFHSTVLGKMTWLLAWIREHRKNLLFLVFWIISSLIPFFIAQTKLPNYMVLVFFPIPIFVGGFLALLLRKNSFLTLVCALSLINFFPIFRLHASDFGEAHFFIPKLFIRFLGFSDNNLITFSFLLLIILAWSYLKFGKQKSIWFKYFVFTLFIGMNVLVPFNPLRNEFIKNLGQNITLSAHGEPATLYYKIRPDQFSFNCVGAFYLPIGTTIKSLENENDFEILSPNNALQTNTFCFFEKTYEQAIFSKKAFAIYNEGVLTKCSLKNKY